jgi:hypothetical protein
MIVGENNENGRKENRAYPQNKLCRRKAHKETSSLLHIMTEFATQQIQNHYISITE